MPAEAPVNSDTNTITNASAIPVLNPATTNGSDAGKITFHKVASPLTRNVRAPQMKVFGICSVPRCVLIQTGKKTAKEIEKIFDGSPIPNQTITSGIIATGGK